MRFGRCLGKWTSIPEFRRCFSTRKVFSGDTFVRGVCVREIVWYEECDFGGFRTRSVILEIVLYLKFVDHVLPDELVGVHVDADREVEGHND